MANIDAQPQLVRGPHARQLWPAGIALVLALAAPAVSLLPALMTGVHGTGAAITFPHGFAVALLVTVAVTAAACAAGAWLARRAGLAAIPLGLALWSVIGVATIAAGLSLGTPTSPTGESCCCPPSRRAWPPGFRSLRAPSPTGFGPVHRRDPQGRQLLPRDVTCCNYWSGPLPD